MFVSQVKVMLSRISSRVKLPTGLLSTNACDDVVVALGVVIDHPGRERDRRVGNAVQGLRTIAHLHSVADTRA